MGVVLLAEIGGSAERAVRERAHPASVHSRIMGRTKPGRLSPNLHIIVLRSKEAKQTPFASGIGSSGDMHKRRHLSERICREGLAEWPKSGSLYWARAIAPYSRLWTLDLADSGDTPNLKLLSRPGWLTNVQFLLNQSLAELFQRTRSKFKINSSIRSWAGLGYENLQEQDCSPVIFREGNSGSVESLPSSVWAGLNIIQYFLSYWVACSIGIRPLANTTLHKLSAARF